MVKIRCLLCAKHTFKHFANVTNLILTLTKQGKY